MGLHRRSLPPVIVVSPIGTRTPPPGANPTTAPTVTTQAISGIGTTTATGNGNVTSDGNSPITERGVCWSTSANPTTSDSKATSAGTTGAYTVSMTGLNANTLYHARAYAINAIGTSYGSDVTATTDSTLYPNQPAGTTVIFETDDTQLPISGSTAVASHVLNGNVTNASTSADFTLISTGTAPEAGYPNIPACPTGQAKVRMHRFPTGLAPGNSSGGGFYGGANNVLVGAHGGPAADEYSPFYIAQWICIFGNGTNMEVPAANLWKWDYGGATWNNLPASGPQSGFGQYEHIFNGVTATTHAGAPDTYTQFKPAVYTQNFTNQNQIQNQNPGTVMNVGTWYLLEVVFTTGTDRGANGGVDIYVGDGTTQTHVASYTNTQWLDSTQTLANGQPGNAGFTCFVDSVVWGGGGGANKSRNDYVCYGHTFVAGTFLRARQ